MLAVGGGRGGRRKRQWGALLGWHQPAGVVSSLSRAFVCAPPSPHSTGTMAHTHTHISPLRSMSRLLDAYTCSRGCIIGQPSRVHVMCGTLILFLPSYQRLSFHASIHSPSNKDIHKKKDTKIALQTPGVLCLLVQHYLQNKLL